MSKIVFITGASSGFGKACAEAFAAAGYRLILNARRKERLEQLKNELADKHGTAVYLLPFDVQQKDQVEKAIGELPDEWKSIDILINNAGLALGRDYFEEASMDDWETMIDTNVKGLLYVSRAVVPAMIAKGSGHIINMGSIAGKEVYEMGNVYCASKSAVDAISKAMRADLLRHSIRVTGIHPGAADTEFSRVRFKGNEEKARKVYEGIKPLSGEDIAGIVLYCASLPEHVCINDLVVTCTQQANSFYTHRKTT